MTSTAEKCPVCGKDAERVIGPREIMVGRRRVTVEDNYLYCTSCQEGYYDPGQADDLLRQAADKIRRDEDLLTPAQIKAIRKGLGLSQTEFETLLGVGAKTVVRWENGTVFQNRAADRLLRLVGGVPKAVDFLGGLSGVSVHGVPRVPALQYAFSVKTSGLQGVYDPGTYWPHSPPLVLRHTSVVATGPTVQSKD